MAAGETNWLSVCAQILVAWIFTTLVYILAVCLLRSDALVIDNAAEVRPMSKTAIVDGYAKSSLLFNKRFNPVSPYSDSFRQIGKSMNASGGAQFTYQFWMRIDDTDASNFQDLVILLKGDDRKYQMGLYDTASNALVRQQPDDYYVACPLIKFVDSYTNMSVQFGTSRKPDVKIGINMSPGSSDGSRRNLLSLLPVNWAMMTFVFEDNVSPSDGKVNGINFTFYMNDVPYQTNSGSTDAVLRNNYLKQNDGAVYILPNPPKTAAFLTLGNVSYFNYALTSDKIVQAYQRGAPTSPMVEEHASDRASSNVMGAYNKIDLYNY